MKDFGYNLHKSRKAAGWTLDKLAEKSGVGKAYISLLERGKRKNPSLKFTLALCNALGLRMPDLLGEGQRIPRLFYYEEGVSSYIPVPPGVESALESMIDWRSVDNQESFDVTFKRIDLTDRELNEMEEA